MVTPWGTLLLLLLHPLYLSPHPISRFPQHCDRVALLRVVEFYEVLHLPDTLKCECQTLCRALLLLLLLLLLLSASLRLLLTTFGHTISSHSGALSWSRQVAPSLKTYPPLLYPARAKTRRPGFSMARFRGYGR
jgi:hypothetical protein